MFTRWLHGSSWCGPLLLACLHIESAEKKLEQPIFSLSSHLENLDRITSTHPHIVTCIQSGFNVKGKKSLVLV